MTHQKKRITKIKVKKGVYFFAWEIYQKDTDSWDAYTMTCKDPPRVELKERILAMVAHVIDICEFDKRDAKRIKVSGITESHTDDNRYITITAQKELEYSKAPLIINTPARPEWVQNEGDDEAYCISRELGDDLKKLEIEAWRYIDGERAQQTLDFEIKDGGDGGDGDGENGGADDEETINPRIPATVYTGDKDAPLMRAPR